jgi:hypothetical protein
MPSDEREGVGPWAVGENSNHRSQSLVPKRQAKANREDRVSLAVTVAWMLVLLCTVGAELAALACYAVVQWAPAPPGRIHPLRPAAGVLLLAAVVTGLLCLVLTPLAHRLLRDKPPALIVAAAVVAGLIPFVTLIAVAWQ